MSSTRVIDKLPGIESAYDFVIPSYNWLLARIEAADTRIHTIQAFATSIAMAIPVTVRSLNPNIQFQDWVFYLAVFIAVAVFVVGLIGRCGGQIALMDPGKLWNSSLSLQDDECRKNAIYWAGENFKLNNCLIEKKWKCSNWMTGLFLVELMAFFAWAVKSPV